MIEHQKQHRDEKPTKAKVPLGDEGSATACASTTAAAASTAPLLVGNQRGSVAETALVLTSLGELEELGTTEPKHRSLAEHARARRKAVSLRKNEQQKALNYVVQQAASSCTPPADDNSAVQKMVALKNRLLARLELSRTKR